jgi:hypothetical protein
MKISHGFPSLSSERWNWSKAVELVNVVRRDGEAFDCGEHTY